MSHVDDVVQLLVDSVRDQGLLEQLISSPNETVEGWNGVFVEYIDEAESEGVELVGSYDRDTHSIYISESAIPSRQTFTLLHELAHHLIAQDFVITDAIQDHASARKIEYRIVEERACDEFAARVLFPSDSTDVKFAAGITGNAILDLRDDSHGSLAAAAVAASRRLSCPGHVLILDQFGRVDFVASSNLPPLPRGSDQSAVAPVAQAMRSGTTATAMTEFEYRDGIRSESLYAQVTPIGGRYLVVAMSEHPPWAERFVLPSHGGGPTSPQYVCANCDVEFTTFEASHASCDQPSCPECGRCGCGSRVTERQCQRCFQLHPVSTMFDGNSLICRDC